MISDRLKFVSDMVKVNGCLADVGCDHAYTDIWLIKQKRIKKAIAMDVRPGPLEKAYEHVKMYGLEEFIDIRLSDGLDNLNENEADSVLISGMGGLLTVKILEEGIHKLKGVKELILSPQSDVFQVRRFLEYIGFYIDYEDMVKDAGKFYVGIHAINKQSEDMDLSDLDEFKVSSEKIMSSVNPVDNDELSEQFFVYKYGRYLLDNKPPVFMEFIEKEMLRIKSVLDGMEKGNNTFNSRYMELKSEYEFLKGHLI
ncbi:MAG: class I SAM-dependent methyltransferase [Lachnospiraceae bacterium]|nr:class I SAM-dependent methyltransferase [Lachnospiraceae bacterium]